MRNNPLILIVDDQEDNRYAIKLALKNESCDFIEAENGDDAINKAVKRVPDVILMDAVMPGTDGFEATRRIRQNPVFERTPILMVTSLNEQADRIRALEAGVNDFITKPFDKSEIIARCRSYVNISRLNKKYIDVTQNPVTGFPNAGALREDLKRTDNSVVLVFKIDGYKDFSEFYPANVVQSMEAGFIELIYKHFPLQREQYKLFHTEAGIFAVMLSRTAEVSLTKEALELSAEEFYTGICSDKMILGNGDEYVFNLSVSIGIDDFMESSYKNALIAADKAQIYKKPYLFADSVIKHSIEEVRNNILWFRRIKEGIYNDRFVPYFQPIYNNSTKKIEKFEALIRLLSDDNEVISPFHFMLISRKSKYYHHLTKIMIEKSMDIFKDKPFDLSVNISFSDIEDDDTRTFLLDQVRKYPDISGRMIFELLEDESFNSFELLDEFVAEVKAFGVKIAMDDFGSGYSSLIRLMKSQPDILKLDGSLIENINNDIFSMNIVKGLKDFTDKMNIQTVAEFVSSRDILDTITEIGITYAQGYHISPPVPAEKIESSSHFLLT